MQPTPITLSNMPAVISGYSSQRHAQKIAGHLGSPIVEITRKQFRDREIQTTIEHNVRGLDVVVVASAAGDPNKQEKEARLLLRAANRSGAKNVTLYLPYMWYGRSDDNWDERNSPALIDTIESLRAHCQSVIIADPHNPALTREKFLDLGSPVKNCTIAHFAYPFALSLRDLIDSGKVSKENLVFAHADAGSTKRISRSFRSCIYKVLDLAGRNADEDDWPQGLKDRDKRTGKITIKGFSCDVSGKDIIVFEDLISSGATALQLASFLKSNNARSVYLFATSGLFTADACMDSFSGSDLDGVFVSDTYCHSLTSPALFNAVEKSEKVVVVETDKYISMIIRALHNKPDDRFAHSQNSVSSILRGVHPDQVAAWSPLGQKVSSN